MIGLACILLPDVPSQAETISESAAMTANSSVPPSDQINAAFGKRIARFRHKASIINFAWSMDGQRLAALAMMDREAFLWDIPSGRTITHFTRSGSQPAAIAFTPDDRYLAMSSTVIRIKSSTDPSLNDISTSISLFDGRTGALVRHLPSFVEGITHLTKGPQPVTRSAPEEILVAKQADLAAAFYTFEPFVTFYNGTSWERLGTISIKDAADVLAHSAAISPDGKHFAAGGRVIVPSASTPSGRTVSDGDAQIVIFDVSTRRIERRFAAHPNKINTLAFSPDGRFLVSGAEVVGMPATAPGYAETLQRDVGRIRVWNVASGERVRSYSVDVTQVTSVAWSPDGRLIAAAGSRRGDWKVYLLDAASDRLLDSVNVDDCFRVAFGADGKSIAYNDGATLIVRAVAEK